MHSLIHKNKLRKLQKHKYERTKPQNDEITERKHIDTKQTQKHKKPTPHTQKKKNNTSRTFSNLKYTESGKWISYLQCIGISIGHICYPSFIAIGSHQQPSVRESANLNKLVTPLAVLSIITAICVKQAII